MSKTKTKTGTWLITGTFERKYRGGDSTQQLKDVLAGCAALYGRPRFLATTTHSTWIAKFAAHGNVGYKVSKRLEKDPDLLIALPGTPDRFVKRAVSKGIALCMVERQAEPTGDAE